MIIESEKPAAAQTMAGTAVKTEVSGLISFHQSLAQAPSLRVSDAALSIYQTICINLQFSMKQSYNLKFRKHNFIGLEKNLSVKFFNKNIL